MKIKIHLKDESSVYFISDFHLFHAKIITPEFDNRPFDNLDEMHEVLIQNWNDVVDKNDTVFYLGDLCFANWEQAVPLVKRLNGNIHFVMGNHDRYQDIQKIGRFNTISDLVDLSITDNKGKKYSFVLCHYPIYSWNKARYGSIMICGHCHHSLDESEFFKSHKIFDVGCNGIDYRPMSYTDILIKFGSLK
jgi:calcineurin-like phosphoesterase family protein